VTADPRARLSREIAVRRVPLTLVPHPFSFLAVFYFASLFHRLPSINPPTSPVRRTEASRLSRIATVMVEHYLTVCYRYIAAITDNYALPLIPVII